MQPAHPPAAGVARAMVPTRLGRADTTIYQFLTRDTRQKRTHRPRNGSRQRRIGTPLRHAASRHEHRLPPRRRLDFPATPPAPAPTHIALALAGEKHDTTEWPAGLLGSSSRGTGEVLKKKKAKMFVPDILSLLWPRRTRHATVTTRAPPRIPGSRPHETHRFAFRVRPRVFRSRSGRARRG